MSVSSTSSIHSISRSLLQAKSANNNNDYEIIPLSPLDSAIPRSVVTCSYIYRKFNEENKDYESSLKSIQSSLIDTVADYPIMCGRIKENSINKHLSVELNNKGINYAVA